MGLVLALGLAGFLGDGALARRTVRTPAGAALTYPRVARTAARAGFRVAVAPAGDDSTRILLPARFAERMPLEAAAPAPAAERATAAGRLLLVAHGHAARGGRVTLTFLPRGPGLVRDTLRVDGAPAPVDLLVLP